jgi:hypothetical protein
MQLLLTRWHPCGVLHTDRMTESVSQPGQPASSGRIDPELDPHISQSKHYVLYPYGAT